MPTLGIKQCHALFAWLRGNLTMGQEIKTATGTSEETPQQMWKNANPLAKLLKEGWWEAFTKDLDLMQKTRWVYFRTNHPTFDHKVSHDLSPTLQHDGRFCWPPWLRHLWGPRHMDWMERTQVCPSCDMRSSPKGLQFCHLLSPLESAKGYGTTRDSSSWCIPLPCYIIILPMVLERRPEWRGLLLIICKQCTTN